MNDSLLIIVVVMVVISLYMIKYFIKRAVLSNSNGQENWDRLTFSFKESMGLIFAFVAGILSVIFKSLFSSKK